VATPPAIHNTNCGNKTHSSNCRANETPA
jgi:hypothetical protein